MADLVLTRLRIAAGVGLVPSNVTREVAHSEVAQVVERPHVSGRFGMANQRYAVRLSVAGHLISLWIVLCGLVDCNIYF